MQGLFAIEDSGKYPTLDMRYTSFLGDEEQVTQVISDGQAVHVVQDGARATVPPAQARFLRLGKTGRGFTDLGVAGWVDDPAVVERPDGARGRRLQRLVRHSDFSAATCRACPAICGRWSTSAAPPNSAALWAPTPHPALRSRWPSNPPGTDPRRP